MDQGGQAPLPNFSDDTKCAFFPAAKCPLPFSENIV